MTTIEFLEHLLENAKNNKPLKEGLYYDNSIVTSSIEGTDWSNLLLYSKYPPRQINGFTVPAPAKTKLDQGTVYYTPNISINSYYSKAQWNNVWGDFTMLERGLVFLTVEAAIANCKAMLGIDPND